MKNSSVIHVIDNNIKILKYALKHAPVYTLITCFLGSLHTIIIYFEHTYMIKYIIDCIQYDKPFIFAFRYILIIFISVSIWLFINWLWWSGWRAKLQEKLFKEIQNSIYKKAVSLDLDYYDNPNYYNDYVWSMSESNTRICSVIDSFENLIKSITGLLVCGIFILSYDLLGIIFVLIAFLGSYVCNLIINKVQFQFIEEMKPRQRRRDYINRVFYLKDYAEELRLYNLKKKLFSDHKAVNKSIIQTINAYSSKLTKLGFISDFMLNTFIFNGLYILYLLYKTMVVQVLSYGTMVALFHSVTQFKGAISGFASAIPRFQENSLYIDRINEFVSYQNNIKDGSKDIVEKNVTLELKNVTFSYSSYSNSILHNVNMLVRPKEKIAIVGQNGAGKTTLINLLLRLYDTTSGDILINGCKIKEFTLNTYRDKFSVVFQDFQIYAATIKENIAMDDTYIEEKIAYAIKESGLAKKISSLKNGINSVCTKEFDENGVNFSGGEVQKICIARALYKNSEIIILDEASSALDPISEYKFNKMITDQFKDNTVIFISHRLSTTRMADRIYLLDKGTISEEGNHDKLMELGGTYARMYNLQAEKYNNI